MNKRDLKAYVRIDGTGRVVAGSLVLRKQKPKVGTWQEVQGYQCCNQDQSPVLVEIEGSFPFTHGSITVGPNDGDVYQFFTSYPDVSAADIDELAAKFNTTVPNLGTFRVVDGNLYWTPSIQIAKFYATNHTTSLYATAFED